MGVGAADTCDGEGAPLDSLQNRKVTPGWLRGQSCPGLALSLVLSNSWAVPAPLLPWFSCTQKGRRRRVEGHLLVQEVKEELISTRSEQLEPQQ